MTLLFLAMQLLSDLSTPKIASQPNAIVGDYVNSYNNDSSKIEYSDEYKMYSVYFHDIIEDVGPCDYPGLNFCLMASTVVVMIPDVMEVGYIKKYPHSSVEVIDDINNFSIGNASCGRVKVLTTSLKWNVKYPAETYNIIWSSEYGLVGYSSFSEGLNYDDFYYRTDACQEL